MRDLSTSVAALVSLEMTSLGVTLWGELLPSLGVTLCSELRPSFGVIMIGDSIHLGFARLRIWCAGLSAASLNGAYNLALLGAASILKFCCLRLKPRTWKLRL